MIPLPHNVLPHNVLPHCPAAKRIAIIGGGPRGLYVVESLSRHFARWDPRNGTPSRPIEVVVFEPTGCIGAGVVYHPNNPSHLRMNYASRHITAYPPNDSSPTPETKKQDNDQIQDVAEPSFTQWCESLGKTIDPDAPAPRAEVGRYLNDCYRRVVENLPPGMKVDLVTRPVTSIERQVDRWRVEGDRHAEWFDCVVVTTGHEGWRPPVTPSSSESVNAPGPRTIDGIYPTQRQLSADRVPPQSNVRVQGFGLTAIDAFLSLTEGRGGKFVFSARSSFDGDHPVSGPCRYEGQGDAVAKIYPGSRSGRPMLAKPVDGRFEPSPTLDGMFSEHRDRLAVLSRRAAGGESVSFADEVLPIVWSAADAAVSIRGGEVESCETFFRRWCQWKMSPTEVHRTLCQSLAVASGESSVDAGWGIGLAWRQLYGEVTTVVGGYVGGGGLNKEAFEDYRRDSAELERIAFGPPAANVARCLALIEAGVLDLTRLRTERGSDPPTWIQIDARIPGPQQRDSSGVVSAMIRDGHLELDADRDAVRVDALGRPLVRGRVNSPNIAVFGRCTEGWVIGNDSLSRSLHRRIDDWARWQCDTPADSLAATQSVGPPIYPSSQGDESTKTLSTSIAAGV